MYFSLQWRYHISFVLGFACFQHHPTPPQHHPETPTTRKKREVSDVCCGCTTRHLIWMYFFTSANGKTKKLKGSRRMQSGQGQLCTVSILILTVRRCGCVFPLWNSQLDVNKNKMLQPTCDLICGNGWTQMTSKNTPDGDLASLSP